MEVSGLIAGNTIKMRDDWLDGTPFTSWVLPRVLLLIFVALPMAVAAVGEWRQTRWSYAAGLVAGAAQIGWIFAQWLIIQMYFFLQPVMLAAGVAVLALTWWIHRGERIRFDIREEGAPTRVIILCSPRRRPAVGLVNLCHPSIYHTSGGVIMRVIIVFESSYGNTRQVAGAIADGLCAAHNISTGSPGERGAVAEADLLVVGGPTHVHGMSRPDTRASAVAAADRSSGALAVDPAAGGIGVREWLGTLRGANGWAAAFDTRRDLAPLFTGRASKGIAHLMQHAGFRLITGPKSFLVTQATELAPDQLAAARQWESLSLALTTPAVGRR